MNSADMIDDYLKNLKSGTEEGERSATKANKFSPARIEEKENDANKPKRKTFIQHLTPTKNAKVEAPKLAKNPPTPTRASPLNKPVQLAPINEARTYSLTSPNEKVLKSKEKMRTELINMYNRNNALEEMQIEYCQTIDQLNQNLKNVQSEKLQLENDNKELREQVAELSKQLQGFEKINESIERDKWRQFCSKQNYFPPPHN